MSTSDHAITASDVEETLAIARRLAAHLQAGDVVLLEGPLGSGKTTFVRGIVEGLEHPDPREVASPTFAIHHRYEGGRLPVNHLDLYRLQGTGEMQRQGILDPLADAGAVTLVEWAERLGTPVSEAVLVISLAHLGPESRSLALVGLGRRGMQLVSACVA